MPGFYLPLGTESQKGDNTDTRKMPFFKKLRRFSSKHKSKFLSNLKKLLDPTTIIAPVSTDMITEMCKLTFPVGVPRRGRCYFVVGSIYDYIITRGTTLLYCFSVLHFG